MSTQPQGPTRIRTSDAEREEVVEILRAAMGEGRLTLDEGEERIAAGYAAKFRDELPALTADLPDGGKPAARNTPEARARFAEHAKRRLARHAGFTVVVGAILIGIWALSGAHFFWPAIPLAFLFLGLLRRAAWRHHGYRYQHYRVMR